MDDKSNRGAQDRGRVSTEERYEVDYLAKKHGVSREVVENVAKQVGPSRKAIEEKLAGMKGTN